VAGKVWGAGAVGGGGGVGAPGAVGGGDGTVAVVEDDARPPTPAGITAADKSCGRSKPSSVSNFSSMMGGGGGAPNGARGAVPGAGATDTASILEVSTLTGSVLMRRNCNAGGRTSRKVFFSLIVSPSSVKESVAGAKGSWLNSDEDTEAGFNLVSHRYLSPRPKPDGANSGTEAGTETGADDGADGPKRSGTLMGSIAKGAGVSNQSGVSIRSSGMPGGSPGLASLGEMKPSLQSCQTSSSGPTGKPGT